MKEKISLAFKPTKKKIIVLAVLVTLAALLAGFIGMGGPAGGGGMQGQGGISRTSPLERGDLASTISATGMIYSTDITEVYSSLSYQVKAIHAEVGDKVAEGDILAELDSTALEMDIEKSKASLNNSRLSANQSLSAAQQDLATLKNNIANDYNSNLLNAKANVETAQRNVESAELDVQERGNTARTARRNLQDARNGEGDYEYEGATDAQIDKLRDALSTAETNLEKAQLSLEGAKASLANAQASLKAAEANVNDSIISSQNQVKSAQLKTDFTDQEIALEKLEKDLEKCTVTAPVSGTITAVNAVEGASGSGILFVIQDTDSLKVVTNIKEYDVGTVGIGDKVIIKTDSTGDTEFSGTLSKIAPTSTLTAKGAASASTDAEFESEVLVAKGSKGLRVGMNTRLSIITEERKNVFFVPYEAVGYAPDGSAFISVQKTGEDGSEFFESIPVTTGLETNLYLEVSGDALEEGMLVARNAQSGANATASGAMSASGPPDGMQFQTAQGGGGMRVGGTGGMTGLWLAGGLR